MVMSKAADDYPINLCQLCFDFRKPLNFLYGKKKISTITEADIQTYINTLYHEGRLDKTGGLTVKTIRDIILVLRLCLIFAYKEQIIPMLNWDLIEYPKDLGIKKSNFLIKR